MNVHLAVRDIEVLHSLHTYPYNLSLISYVVKVEHGNMKPTSVGISLHNIHLTLIKEWHTSY
jgi:hypothetical protein